MRYLNKLAFVLLQESIPNGQPKQKGDLLYTVHTPFLLHAWNNYQNDFEGQAFGWNPVKHEQM